VVAVQPDVPDARRWDEARDPPTIPSPARRIGTSVSFFPLTRHPLARSSGVSTGAGSTARSLVTSYAISIAISSTSSLNIFVGVARSRRMVSLCWMSGCPMIVRVGRSASARMGATGEGEGVRLRVNEERGIRKGLRATVPYSSFLVRLPPHLSLPRRSTLPSTPMMREYQAVIFKLSRRAQEDEDALTDLLNERSRGGWEPVMMSHDEHRMTLVFARAAVPEQ
jgi:hypothetical protein